MTIFTIMAIAVGILLTATLGGCIVLALLYDYEAAGSAGCVPPGYKGI